MIVMVMMPWIEVTRESETEDHQCSVTNFLYERKFAKKNTVGVRAHFLQKYER